MQKVMSVAPSTLDDLADDTDGNDNDADNNDTEMEELRKTVKGIIMFNNYCSIATKHNIGCV